MEEEKKLELEYYKNSIIHFFIAHALVAVSLLTGKEETKNPEAILEDYIFLKHLFRNEFVFVETENLAEEMLALIGYFLEGHYLSESKEDGGYSITKMGFDKLPIFAALAQTFLESYWITAKCMQDKYGSKKGELLKSISSTAKKYHKLQIIDHIGALSPPNFQNALTAINQDLQGAKRHSADEEASIPEALASIIRRLYEFSHYTR